MKDAAEDLKTGPEDGCYITGMFIEGARWDMDKFTLVESRAKELFTQMPCFWLIPEPNRKPPTSGIYECPLYKTLTRAGLSRFIDNIKNITLTWLSMISFYHTYISIM